MKVYIVTQTHCDPFDIMEESLIGVYDSKEKATKIVQQLFKEDKDWILEHCKIEDIKEEYIHELHSFIQGGEYWAENKIYVETVE